ncbi:hypothetical protein Aspvir_002533 [Aspergillus viridinutans]|uniref:F-box domain-containing protein n=1 Tax=Aspergillus viridinutans TaxID=75553 RepID=A0A9P3FA34_ASPVI|nr:uncharacterized protein Aspvir_002533 [Aspergillus viridinutans]GIK06880.1 hypothetical protein Aspvir_002533 [Aspergillus viridinutans]
MYSSASHRIFGIPEVLEEILLQVHLPTLLTSAQRVCRMWHRVIQDSNALQKALFFKPSEKRVDPEERRTNPFVQSNLWRGLFRKKVQDHSRAHVRRKREVYLRREASWRRMLLKQPPSNKITIVGSLYLDTRNLIPSQLALNPRSDWCRLGDLYSGIEKEIIFPAHDPFVFLCVVYPLSEYPVSIASENDFGILKTRSSMHRAGNLIKLDPKLRPPWSTLPISKLLIDCDVVFFHRGIPSTLSTWVQFEDWLWSLGKFDLEPTLGADLDDNWCFGFPGLRSLRRSHPKYFDSDVAAFSHFFLVDLALHRRKRARVSQSQSGILPHN